MLERYSPMLLCDRAEGRGVTVFMGVVIHFRMLVVTLRALTLRCAGSCR